MSYRETTLADFLAELSSGDATPGGGCAAALSGALAAGLVAMVARNSGGLDDVAAEADGLRGRLEELIDADAAAFERVMAAFGLPKETDEQKAERRATVQAAYKGAVEPPLAVCAAACRVLALAAVVAEQGNRNAISDAGVAALLAATAVDGAALNVDINLAAIKDEIYGAASAKAVGEARTNSARLRDETLATVEEALR